MKCWPEKQASSTKSNVFLHAAKTAANYPLNSIENWLKSHQPGIRRLLNLSLMLGMVNGILIILQAWLLAFIINAAVFRHESLTSILPWLWSILPVFIIRFFLVLASERTAFEGAAEMQKVLREQLYDHCQALGPLWLASRASGDLANRVATGIEALHGYYARWLPNRALSVLLPLTILVAVFPTDWVSGLVLVLTAPFIPVFMILIGKGAEDLNQRQWRQLARMSGRFLDALQGLTTLKLFNASRREAQVVAEISEDYRASTMKVLRVAFLSSLVLEFLSTVSIAVVAVLIGFRLLWGDIAFLPGFFVLLLAPEFYLPLRSLGGHYHARMEAIGAAEGVVEILQTSLPDRMPRQETDPVPDTLLGVQFKDVEFAYEPDRPALRGATFNAQAGCVTALVGTSGAGKSTVLNLLLGFAKPQHGSIRVNNLHLARFDDAAWLEHVAWVPQHPHVFTGTVLDNIRMARPAASDEEVEAAARAAGAHDFILALPRRYHTPVGERGAGLSGGEVQRLALARAFLKNAPLVILDEATAHLDGHAQAVVIDAIAELARGRTVIMAAHRLSTLALAHHVVVLEEGRVVEAGERAALMASGHALARLARIGNTAVAAG